MENASLPLAKDDGADEGVDNLTDMIGEAVIQGQEIQDNPGQGGGDLKFWFEFDDNASEDGSPLLCNTFETLISTLEICGNWQEYGQLKDSKDVKGRSMKSLVSEHCYNITRAIQKQYKINYITERELNSLVMPFEGESSIELSAPWKLTLVLLDVLGQLRLAIDIQERDQPESEKQIEVMSLAAKLNLAKVIELVTGFGLLQNLSEDLNLPPLSSFSREFVEQLSEKVKLTELARFYRLAYIMDVFCFVIKCPLIEGRLQRVNLHLLAATLQVIDAPISEPDPISEQPKKKRSIKEMKEAVRLNYENGYFYDLIRIRIGIQESSQVYLMHYCYDPEILKKYNPILFTVRAKAKLITTLLAFGALPNPKWVKECASQHATRILINDTNGLHIYYIALSDNVRQTRSALSPMDAFWRVAGTIGNFIKCVLMDMKSLEGRQEFVCCIAEQALRMIMSNSGLRIHAHLKTSDNEGSSTKIDATGLETEEKCLFSFGIFAAYYLTKTHSKLVMERFWIVLYREWLEIPSSADAVLDLVEISQQFLSCRHLAIKTGPAMNNPNNSNGHIIYLVGIWRLHFFTFLATRNYLEGSVQSVEVAEKLKIVDEKLGLILIDLFESIHATTNLRICDLLSNMTYNLDSENNPCALSLCWVEEIDEQTNQTKVKLSAKPIEDLMDISSKSKELYRIIEEGVKTLTKLLTTRPVSSELLPTIFQELLEDDVRRESDPCRIDPLQIIQPEHVLQVFDLQNSSDCGRLTSILLLSSFENNLDSIIENLGIDDGKKALNYLMLILRRVVLQIEESEAKKVEFVFKDTLLSAIRTTQSIMDLLYASQAFNASASLTNSTPQISWDGFAPLIPYLHRLKECKHPMLKDSQIQESINDLHIRIVTHCKGVDQKKSSEESQAPYYKALTESNDSAPYVQANGLLTLRRLLESKDELALKNKNVIFGVFHSALEQSDSYVYLQAIRGLTIMGSTWSSECLPKLISDYKRTLFNSVREAPRISDYSDSDRFVAVTKLGEAITKIMKELGPMGVQYRDQVFDATMCLMRDNDPLLRASGLSTLAELCEILEIPFEAIVNHVWNVIEGLALDRDLNVRRAAFHLGTKSLRGMANMVERDGPSILMNSDNYAVFLRNASQKTKLWLSSESDEQCRLHLQLAYDELQRVYNTLVTVPEQGVLEKKITIYGS